MLRCKVINLARRHFQKHQAKQQAASATVFGEMKRTTMYEQTLMQLKRDQSLLKNIQAKTSKIKTKEQFFENYKPYVDGILEARPNLPDDIIANMLVWAVDISNYDYAFKIMDYMLLAKLDMPDCFQRTLATFVYEQIADTQLNLLSAEDEDEPFNLDVLVKLEALLHEHEKYPENAFDMPDEVKARLYLALGKAELKQNSTTEFPLIHAENAKSYLEQALKLDSKCRGKNDLKTATKLVQELSEQTTAM